MGAALAGGLADHSVVEFWRGREPRRFFVRSMFASGALSLPLAVAQGGQISTAAVLAGTAAGAIYGGGLLWYFRGHWSPGSGTARTAPATAVAFVSVPLVADVIFGLRPSLRLATGLLAGGLSLWLLSGRGPLFRGVGGGIGAGAAFGSAGTLLSLAPLASGWWPLLFLRISSGAMLWATSPRTPPEGSGRKGETALPALLWTASSVCYLQGVRHSLTAASVCYAYSNAVTLGAQLLRGNVPRASGGQWAGWGLGALCVYLVVGG